MNICFYPHKEAEQLRSCQLRTVWLVDENASYIVRHVWDAEDIRLIIRTLDGMGRILLTDGTVIHASPQSVLRLSRKDIVEYRTQGERWHFYWLEYTLSAFGGRLQMHKTIPSWEEAVLKQVCYALSAGDEETAQSGFQFLLAVWERQEPCGQEKSLALSVARLLDFSPLDSPCSTIQLAGRFGVGERTMRKHFLETFHMTPRAYLHRRRIETAKRLLTVTDWTVQEIAEKVGLPDAFYFSRCFKAETGCSPLQYRQEQSDPKKA